VPEPLFVRPSFSNASGEASPGNQEKDENEQKDADNAENKATGLTRR